MRALHSPSSARVVCGAFAVLCACATARALQSAPALAAPRTASGPALSVPLTGAITREEIEAHVRFLAADELLGRMTGTPECERAARYLALVLERAGVEPAGDEHGYLQAVPLETSRATAAPELAIRTKAGETLTAIAGRDFDFPSWAGIEAGELRFVRAASADQMPTKAAADVALFVDATTTKERTAWLEKAGLGKGEGFGLLVQPGSSRAGDPERYRPRPATPRRPDTGPRRRAWLTLNGEFLSQARAGAFASLNLVTHVETHKLQSYNVLGRIRGAGTAEHPELAGQAIVLSAHYDHLDEAHAHAPPRPKPAAASGPQGSRAQGSGPQGGGTQGAGPEGSEAKGSGEPAPASAAPREDHVFNGADDDASGCAAVLELAGAFAAGARPARTLVFLLATGEEIGLLGTEEYIDHPAEALDRTVANLNFEMIGRPDPLVGGTGVLWLTGFEKSNLGPAFQAAGLAVKVDPRPEQHFYERSDNIAFVRRGIVGQTFSSFNLHADYHQVGDEADKIDFAHMEACVRTGYEAVRLVADGQVMPTWAEGQRPTPRK